MTNRLNSTGRMAPLGALLAAVLLAAPALADAVRPRPDLAPGRSWTYDLSLDLMVRQSQVDSRVVQTARARFAVQAVDDSGVATIGCALQSLVAVWTDGAGQSEFVWSGGDAPPAPGDNENAFQAASRALAGATLTLKVGPDGRVRSVDGVQDAMNALGDDKRFTTASLGLFAPGQAAPALEAIWRADRLVDGPRSAGEGWQTSVRIPLGPAGALEVTTDWAVLTVSDDAINYAGDERAEVLRPAHPDPAAPAVRVEGFQGRVEGQWSLRAGAIRTRKATRNMTAAWSLGDLAVEQSQVAKTELTLVEPPVR